MGKGPQAKYEVVPADHALRAVPLVAGKHYITMRYEPAGWTVGWMVSAGAWGALGGVLVWKRIRARRAIR